MIEPFSIFEATNTASSVTHKLTQLIKNLAHAPEELLALSNELWNLQMVLQDCRQSRKSVGELNPLSTNSHDALGALILQARVKIDDLNGLISQWGRLNQWGDSWSMGRRDRFLWLKEKKQVASLKAAMRELRSNIVAVTGIQTSVGVTRLEVDVRSLAEQYTRLHAAAVEHAHESQSVTATVQKSDLSIASIQQTQSESKDLLLDMLATLERMSVDKPIDRRFDDYVDDTRDSPLRVDLPSSRLPNTPLAEKGNGFVSPMADQSVFSMSVRAKLKSSRLCPATCCCPCHGKTQLQTPRLLQRLAGRLFLGYTGAPYLSYQCLPDCSRKGSSSLNMTYFFPKWFFEKAVTISVTEGLLGTPNLNIKVRRLVPEMSQVFAMSRYGDVEGLKTLFMQRQASPDDVHIRGGWTALHFAIDHGNINACKLLLECGADPEWEDATGTTPVEIAWRNILHLRAPPKISESFSVLFPGTEFLQERKFTRLHKLVIDLEIGDVEKELRTSPQSVHITDIDGWTPLHWAARRGNSNALVQLLAYGADPLHVTGNESRNALHLAAQGNSVSCISSLLQWRRGSNVIDIESRDSYGNTALRISAGYNCAAATAKLIQLGADLNAPDNFEEPPLLPAVYENAHETITVLLDAGVDYARKTKFGNTILHFAANESDAQTLSLLARANMHGVDVGRKNVDGLTATDLAIARGRAPLDFMVLFERLVESITEDDDDGGTHSRASYSSAAESWKSFEEIVWMDALAGANADIADHEQEAHSPLLPSDTSILEAHDLDDELIDTADFAAGGAQSGEPV